MRQNIVIKVIHTDSSASILKPLQPFYVGFLAGAPQSDRVIKKQIVLLPYTEIRCDLGINLLNLCNKPTLLDYVRERESI